MASRSGRRSPSVLSAMSSSTQRRIAEADAEEAIAKMEMEVNDLIDKKKDELSHFQIEMRKAENRQDFKAYEEAKVDVEATEADIERLQHNLKRKRAEIAKKLEATVRKFRILEEEEQLVNEGSDDGKQQRAQDVIDDWLGKMPSPPTTIEVMQPPPVLET